MGGWVHLFFGVLRVKFDFPIPLEVYSIDKDETSQGVQHVRLDEVLDLLLGDGLHPVIYKASRFLIFTEVCVLRYKISNIIITFTLPEYWRGNTDVECF